MDLDNGVLSEAAQAVQREYKREYMRRWRAINKERVAANNRRYWERKAAQAAEADNESEKSD